MEGRDAMAMPGSAAHYILYRGRRTLANPAAAYSHNPSPPPPPPPGGGEPVKRKRGRPRKYVPDAPAPAQGQKRGRGRPPGTGSKQQLASLGELVSGSAGTSFTPHVIVIAAGEDITAKIMSFSQQGPRAVCILSAYGAVSTVTLCQPTTSGGTVTYQGHFQILSLSGSYVLTDVDGSPTRTGGLSISLSNTDGRIIAGGVGGRLIAATPVQLIVGSYIYDGAKGKKKMSIKQESAAETDSLMSDTQSAPTSTSALPNQNMNHTMMMGGWPVSR